MQLHVRVYGVRRKEVVVIKGGVWYYMHGDPTERCQRETGQHCA